MQITNVEVIPVELPLNQPVQMAGVPSIASIQAIFIRMETRTGQNAWGCTVTHPSLLDDEPEEVLSACYRCADIVPDMHPTQIEYSLSQLSPLVAKAPTALTAFDLAFHDLLGLAAGMPLYRLLGGYRYRIQSSATVPLASTNESVEIAKKRAATGYQILKIKGGLDPDEDVRRIRAINRALPHIKLRLDVDGGYTVIQALEISRALEGKIEMFEQPSRSDDINLLREIKNHSSIPILADQSVKGPESALHIASSGSADGLSIKMACCGGFRCASQIDAIARAARIVTMVSCLIEPALLVAAGLHFALSSPTVQYGDLDGYLDLINDPTIIGFELKDGWLTAADVPGLGCSVDI